MSVRKKILIGVLVVVSLAILYVGPVLAQGVSLKYWSKLGYPNAIEIFFCNIDEYPGHSLECLRFPNELLEELNEDNVIVYTEKGTGIDINGYELYIGDTREHVKEECKYLDPDGIGGQYELGCYYCETHSFLTFYFSYDEEDRLKKIRVWKETYYEEEYGYEE